MMGYYSVKLNENGSTGLTRDTAKKVLREVAKVVLLPASEFILSGVRSDGTYYAIFLAGGPRAIFAGLLTGAGVFHQAIDGPPEGVKLPPPRTSAMPTLMNARALLATVEGMTGAIKLLRDRNK